MSLLAQLKQWRNDQARREGVELFRVFSNSTLEELARSKPVTDAELLNIKGIKEKKLQKYGKALLELIRGEEGEDVTPSSGDANEEQEKMFSVSDYLDAVNVTLAGLSARIRGEVSSFDIRGSYLFFTLKDKDDESSLSCFMWRRDYDMCGVQIEEGMEVAVEGVPEVYKPSGRMTFRSRTIELVGEGALKKAYDELKKKLEKEGVFAPERKKTISDYPQRIGLITSKEGAVIHDFLNNLGQHGFSTTFINSRVEGQVAVQELYSAIRSFRKKNIDVLVIIRGGGSLESLQAFNNEKLVREIKNLPFPVICGIGHHQDAPLMTLAADMATSTPTAATKLLNHSWEHALAKVQLMQQSIVNTYEQTIQKEKNTLEQSAHQLGVAFGVIIDRFKVVYHKIAEKADSIRYGLQRNSEQIDTAKKTILSQFSSCKERVLNSIELAKKVLSYNDPHRQLKLGYSLVSHEGKLVRTAGQVKKGEMLDVRLTDGIVRSKVTGINTLSK